MSIPILSSVDPIQITTASSVANLSFTRSDISDTVTITHNSVSNIGVSATLTATGFVGIGSGLTGILFSQIGSKPTTLSGYGITPQVADYSSFYLQTTQQAIDSAKLGGVTAASYALLASPTFSGTVTATGYYILKKQTVCSSV